MQYYSFEIKALQNREIIIVALTVTKVASDVSAGFDEKTVGPHSLPANEEAWSEKVWPVEV